MIAPNKISNLESAIQYFNNNDLISAKNQVHVFLRHNPNHAVANKLISMILYREKNFVPALEYLHKVVKVNSTDYESLNLTGAINLELKNYSEAEKHLQAALRLKPGYIDGLFNLGLLKYETRRFSEAIDLFNHLLTIKPEHYNARIYRALSMEGIGLYSQAEPELRELIKTFPSKLNIVQSLCRCYLELKNTEAIYQLAASLNDDNLRFNIGNVCLTNNFPNEALTIYQSIAESFTDKSSLLNNMASAFDKVDQPEKAIELFKQSIAINPDYIGAYSNLGRVMCDLNRMDEAKDILEKALKKDPHNSNALINLGRVYNLQHSYEKARAIYLKALEYDPKNATALYNVGNTYHKTGNFLKSSEYFSRCLLSDPNYADAEYNLGMNELALGKFESAWGHYFKRVRYLNHGEKLSSITPGMNFSGKRIYFCYSQGIGDELFFLRFLPWLKQQNVHICYRTSPKLVQLLSNHPCIDTLLRDSDVTPECDYYFTIDDIPLVLGMNNINQIPPAFPLPKPLPDAIEKLNQQYGALPRPFIGITWRAGTQVEKRTFRSNQARLSKVFSLDDMIHIVSDIPGTVFILQRNPKADEITQLKSRLAQVIDASALNNDLVSMLALLDFIDDSVCVSNANVHLLAGISKKANVLIPYPPEWRWMDMQTNSPWFPSMDTFRQTNNGDWQPAILALKARLEQMYASN